MATIRLPTDFSEFIQLLNQHEVDYLLIGGYAVNLYGFARATGDMDIFVALTPANIVRVVATLHEFGFTAASASDMQPGKILRMGVPPLRLEIFNQISGVEFDEAYAAREMMTLGELSVPVISLGHLRRNKAASGRPKDLGDLSELPTEHSFRNPADRAAFLAVLDNAPDVPPLPGDELP